MPRPFNIGASTARDGPDKSGTKIYCARTSQLIMRKFILYIAFSLDEVYECAYSILKYLEVYNLKPPADHALVVYTHYPELLEAFGSFFSGFELKPVPADSGKESIVHEFKNAVDGQVLYLDVHTYPVKTLDASFSEGTGIDENTASYKDLKEFKILLKDFFGRYQEESIPNQVKLLHNVDAKKIEKQKQQFEKLPLASKWLRKIMGRGWDISNYLIRI